VILRLGETTGQAVPAVQVSAGMGIQDAKETDGMEEHGKPLPVAGGEVTLDFAAYQMRTLSLALVPPGEPLDQPASRPVPLPYDLDVVSPNEARGDGQFGPVKGGEAAYPAELLPAAIGDAGVTFTLGPTGPGQANAVACKGQQIPLEPVPGERLVLLAAALFDTTATFRVGDEETLLSIQAWTGTVGQWVNRVDANDHVIEDPAKWSAPFVKPDRIAWVGTHRHLPGEDDPYRFTYLFRYVLPVPPGAATLTLPDAPEVRVLAASLVRDPNDQTVAASRLHDDFEPLNEPIDWALAAAEEPPPPEPDSVESAETADAVQAEAEPDAGSEGGSGRGGCSAAMHSRAAGWWQLALLGLGAMFHRRRSHHP
jgi:alpha-mannosidase